MNLALFSNARNRISFITTMKRSVGVFKYQRVFNRNNTDTWPCEDLLVIRIALVPGNAGEMRLCNVPQVLSSVHLGTCASTVCVLDIE